MRLIDFHCDTPVELYKKRASVFENDLMVDVKKARCFRSYTQLAAVFCPPHLPDCEGLGYVESVLRYLKQSGAAMISERKAFLQSVQSGYPAFIPSVEDARVLNRDLCNIDTLYALGVRFATLLWRDESIIGGAWNTNAGLTLFGKKAVSHFLDLGIIPDVSHASAASLEDTAALCIAYGKPLVATHSNAFSIAPHKRNLSDEQIRSVARTGGVIGVNLYPPFLSCRDDATLDDVVAHIQHLVRIAGEEAIVLGSDLDGIDLLPKSIFDVSSLLLLADVMKANGFTERQIDLVLFENGHRFLSENLP